LPYLPIQLVIVHLVEGVIPFLPEAANFDPQLLQAGAELIGHLLQFCLAPRKKIVEPLYS
jgi:hypothetical protein